MTGIDLVSARYTLSAVAVETEGDEVISLHNVEG